AAGIALFYTPAAARSGARRAAETVTADRDGAPLERLAIEVSNVRRAVELDVEHLVEIAVVEPSVPSDRQDGPAHQAAHRRWIERRDETLHVALQIPGVDQPLEVAADRHVRQAVQRVEDDAVEAAQLAFPFRFQRSLRRREERADRIGHEHEAQARPAVSISNVVQP